MDLHRLRTAALPPRTQASERGVPLSGLSDHEVPVMAARGSEKQSTNNREEAMRSTGTVKWFSDARGFGFITPDNGQKDCFVHFRSIQVEGFKTLAPGARVEFDAVECKKGISAENVCPC